MQTSAASSIPDVHEETVIEVPLKQDDDVASSTVSYVAEPALIGTQKKIIYFCRHAEATHNVMEREAIKASGETDKAKQDLARKAALKGADMAYKDAPLSEQGTAQARTSGKLLQTLFRGGDRVASGGSSGNGSSGNGNITASTSASSPVSSTSKGSGSRGSSTAAANAVPHRPRSSSFYNNFRRPDIVLVSPLRRALMTATELFYDPTSRCNPDEPPPLFLAIEALREKRTGFSCDERNEVEEMSREFPHVDFTDVAHGTTEVPIGEDNLTLRERVQNYLDTRLPFVPGQYLAVVAHKGWLREFRNIVKQRSESQQLRADYDLEEWDKTLYGNAEVRVASLRWQDGELVNVVNRSIENATLIANAAAMMGDGFEFCLGPPHKGFSIFLADRTTKVHFISLAEGRHNVAVRERANNKTATTGGGGGGGFVEDCLLREPDRSVSEHPLFDAGLTKKGGRQADKLREMLAERPSGGRPFTAFDLCIVSPLTRACETAQIIFGKSPGTYGGVAIPPPHILVREECRERYGRYVCDARRTVSELEGEFPTLDFSEMESEQDTLHTDTRETAMDVEERALRLLNWLSNRPERCIAVVTHSEFLRHLFGQFGDTLTEEDRSCLQRTSANCELRSVVLCSHGKVEREMHDAPPSTIRVPSVSSLSSLAAVSS